MQVKFSFYGLAIQVTSPDPQVIQDIKRDYSFFTDERCKAKISIEIFSEPPAYENLPPLTASIYTPRNICYRKENISYIDYFGHGLAIIDSKTNVYKIYSAQAHLRHEIAYLTILSLAGQHLDSQGIHRVHGLGIDLNGKAVLILLPRGGGKTTLLLELLKNDKIKLISEDSPLIDRAGKILPFPMRIGVSENEKPSDLPQEYLHYVERMEFGPKYLIDIDAFKEKVSKAPSSPWIILLGRRSLGAQSGIAPVSKLKTLQEFIRNSVVGLGLYQGVEFLLQTSVIELLGKGGVAFSRLKNSIKVISSSKTYSFVVGCNKKKNTDTLIDFLHIT